MPDKNSNLGDFLRPDDERGHDLKPEVPEHEAEESEPKADAVMGMGVDDAKPKSPMSMKFKGNSVAKMNPWFIRGGAVVGLIVLLTIVFGVLQAGKRKRRGPAENTVPTLATAPVNKQPLSGTQTVDALQEESAKRQLGVAGPNGQTSGAPGVAGGVNGGPGAGAYVAGGKNGTQPPTRLVPMNAAGRPMYEGSGQRLVDPAVEEEQRAMRSPLAVHEATGGAKGADADPTLARLQDRLAAAQQGGGTPAGTVAAGGGSEDDANKQANKAGFLRDSRAPGSEPQVVLASRVLPVTNYEIKAGWDIPATLEQGINSDLPGEVRGVVRENVYDTVTGRYLLIPQGARVIGHYNSVIAYGQNGIQVVWTRLIFPDGTSIQLGGLNGQDVRGLAGFRDKVDNHYLRLIGDVLMSSLFSAGIEIGANGGTTSNNTNELSPQSIAAAATAEQLGQFGMEVARRDMNRQPTVTIPIGYRFNVRVQKDLVFTAPYYPVH
jgi:type IV secretory pathway VirB10-like protein